MKHLILIPALMLGFSAYAQTERNTTQTNTAEATAPAELKDNQIAKVLLTINEGEIKAGKQATKKAGNEEVKKFAQMMVDAHKQNADETKKLAKDQKIKLRDSQMSMRLNDEAQLSMSTLKKAEKNKEFDKAYVADQVMMHEKALMTLDQTLIPQAQNANLKSHLEKTRASVAEHLEHAKSLQSKIQ